MESTFTSNLERALKVGQFDEVQKCTSGSPIYLGTREGVHLFKAETVFAVDTAMPTKKGGVTTALLVCPLSGATSLKWEDGSAELDAGPIWVYKASRQFRVLDAAGDPVRKGRKTAAAEVAELRQQLAAQQELLLQLIQGLKK